jgi:23S rRNA pseudouridine2605 synthase
VLAFLGLQVSRLIRVAYGTVDLAGLEPGAIEEVPQVELDAFRASLK